MKSISLHLPWHSLTAAFLIPLLAFLLACGPGEEPTPAPTATPTQAPVAEPTIPVEGPVATPTPTTEAAPVPTPSEKPKYGGRFLYVASNYVTDYDGIISDNSTIGVYPWLYSTMLEGAQSMEGNKGVVECAMCTDWHLEDGGKTMVINIIQGVKYHDGTEVTSADWAFSYKKAMGQIDGIASIRSGVMKEYIESIETPSRYQIKLHLYRPSLFLPKVLAFGFSAVMPEGTTRAMLKEKPYGSGPWVLKKAIPGASIAMDRNPNYFKPGRPYMDGLDFVVVGDASTRNSLFLTGKVLISGIFAPQYQKRLEGLVAEGKMNLVLNLGGCGHTGIFWVNAKPPFTDIRVRQAINLSLDRTILAHVAWGEDPKYWTPTLLFFGRGQEYGTPEEEIWNVVPGWGTGAKKQQEIEEAKQLMIDAGYENGFDAGLLTNTIPSYGHYAIAIPVEQQLAAIGIRVKIEEVSSAQKAIRMEAWDYDIVSANMCVTSRDPDEAIGGYWITGASRNNFGYSNPVIDDLFVQMTGELDPVKKKEIFFKIQDIIVLEEVRYAPDSRSDTWIWSWKALKNWWPGMMGLSYHGVRFDNVWIDR